LIVPVSANQPWNLESFLDSLIVELDRAQDTLSFKGITRRLTYTVKDVALDLQIFPQFDGRKVKFVTAQPGDAGSSKISIQLGSITDRQIRETTKEPPSKEDLSIDEVDGLDAEVKDSLRKVGITSADDLERVEKRNVDVEKVVTRTGGGEAAGRPAVDYSNLARLIKKARRTRQLAPRVLGVDLDTIDGRRVLNLHGRNLALETSAAPLDREGLGSALGVPERQFPIALLDDEPVAVLGATEKRLQLAVPFGKLHERGAVLRVALDPYAVITMEIKP
jgi:hypothetical protein